MNGKFRVWDGRKYHYNVALINGVAMTEENPQRSDKITINDIDYYSDWAKYKPVKWANENKKGEIVVELCTGLSAFKSYRGIKPEDLEIYENDIISGLSYNQRGLIAWRDGGFGFMYEADTELRKELSGGADWYDFVPFSGHAYLKEILSMFEIIGTIHEETKK